MQRSWVVALAVVDVCLSDEGLALAAGGNQGGGDAGSAPAVGKGDELLLGDGNVGCQHDQRVGGCIEWHGRGLGGVVLVGRGVGIQRDSSG